jgi:hypothetical protein
MPTEATKKLFTVEQFIFSSTMLVHAPGRPGVYRDNGGTTLSR